MLHCVRHCGSSTEQKREKHKHTHRKSVCMSVCYQLSRRVAGWPRFWTKFSSFSGSGFSPLFTSLAVICQHVGSQVQLPLRNSPTTMYALQGSSLKTWFFTQDVRFLCEQVLFVYVLTVIPPRLSDPCNFITVLLVTREPEQTTLLF